MVIFGYTYYMLNRGFSVIVLLLFVIVFVALAGAGFFMLKSTSKNSSSANCNNKPVLALPVAQDRIESVLYPG
jgi:flagellar basal body-associated protein FliL